MRESAKDEFPVFVKEKVNGGKDITDPEAFPTLKEIEQLTIRKALEITNGHKSRSAELLGISRYALYRRLKDLNFD